MSGAAGGHSPTSTPIQYSGLNVGTSQRNLPVPIHWGTRRLSTNAMAFAGFYSKAVSGKGGGKGGGKATQQNTYFADVLLGLGEGPFDASPQNIWANGSTTTTTTLSQLGMTFFTGTLGQAASSTWNSRYPTLQQGYSQTAYLLAINLALGESATIPQNDFECVRTMGFSYTRSSTIAGWINPTYHTQANAVDVLMSDVITDFLTNPQYGQFMASGDLGPITQYAAYCRAQGFFVSPLLNNQEKATDILNRWAQITNAWIFWSGTQLEFVPLADAAITGNGVTFTPANAVAYTLTLDDLIADRNSPPVKVTRKDPADCYNRTSVNICDRTLGYIDNPIPWDDDQLINQFGLRDNTSISANEICDPIVGAIVAQLVGKRAARIRNTYQFKTNWNFILCLPGTVLQIPLNYTGQTLRVRVTDVAEDEKGQLAFTAEEFPGTVGTYVAPQSAATVTTTLFPNLYAAPPNINTPAIFEPPASFTGGVAKVVIAASGGANWGGCQVSISFDGTTYVPVGTITAPAPQGVLTAGLPAYTAANPDTGDTLAVDLTQSGTTPKPVTTADAVYLRTLALVAPQPTISGPASIVPTNGELLAFGNTAITGTYTANLTYLERGQYGTAPIAHASGEQFTLIDVLGTTGATVSFALPDAYIGQVAWLKFASFNQFGLEQQDLSTVVEYQYGIIGAAATPSFTCFVFGEVPAGAINGSNTVFALAQVPYGGSAALFYNGLKLTAGTDYTVSGSTLTMARAPAGGDVITVNYVTPISTAVAAGGPNYADVVYGEVPGGAVNGSNTAFTLAQAPYHATALMLVQNGQTLTRGTDYTITGSTVSMTTAPATGDVLRAYYIAATTTIFTNIGPTFNSFQEGVVPAGAINGSNTTFTLPAVPHSGLIMVTLNGMILTAGTDYTLSGAAITMTTAPATGDTLTTSFIT